MGYKKATKVLPQHLLRAIQEYVDGEYLYIPRKEENRKHWGETAPNRAFRAARNNEMAARRKAGWSVAQLAERYFLSEKAVYKILAALN
ncbi:MAG TPA: CD3324 family protein [Desulfovibrio sp.]|uniref:CD3324 family protein n=1 Tax=Desulfovibrio sp. TaxID=885 RepID=UPI002D57634F|nr:CD3324 family protein [Desulfovibrio sp.]HZF60862.1 CD3324 family protein [Desulfovibrio sp.]